MADLIAKPPHQGTHVSSTPIMTICPNTVLGFVTVSALVFVSTLGSKGVLVFLATGLWMVLRRTDKTGTELRSFWWIYLLPVWCVFSLFWSDHPYLSLRHGAQLGVTFLIAATLANRLSPTVFLRLLFLALVLAGVASLLFGNVRFDGVPIGIFHSKNYYAFTMVALVLCSFALFAAPNETAVWRAAGFLGLVLGLPQIKMADSLGAAFATVFVLAAALAILFTHALPRARRAGLLGLFCIIAVAVVVAGVIYQDAILNLIVERTGKDPTLTGRTDLWSLALGEIARSPLLGTGYRAFWVEGNPLAEQIWAQYYILSKSGFNFHSLFLSNAVEIGLIGLVLVIALLAPALFLSARWLLHARSAPAIFCFTTVTFVLVLSMVEVQVFFEFDTVTVMVLAALVHSIRAAREVPLMRPPGRGGNLP